MHFFTPQNLVLATHRTTFFVSIVLRLLRSVCHREIYLSAVVCECGHTTDYLPSVGNLQTQNWDIVLSPKQLRRHSSSTHQPGWWCVSVPEWRVLLCVTRVLRRQLCCASPLAHPLSVTTLFPSHRRAYRFFQETS